jgi:DNA-directed RNA polymerase subunit RPC12/RpoP
MPFYIMINQESSASGLRCVCPECKNDVSLARYPNIQPGMVIECDHCGMTLLVKEIANNQIQTEIVDEGK